jgi:hypothetical protein
MAGTGSLSREELEAELDRNRVRTPFPSMCRIAHALHRAPWSSLSHTVVKPALARPAAGFRTSWGTASTARSTRCSRSTSATPTASRPGTRAPSSGSSSRSAPKRSSRCSRSRCETRQGHERGLSERARCRAFVGATPGPSDRVSARGVRGGEGSGAAGRRRPAVDVRAPALAVAPCPRSVGAVVSRRLMMRTCRCACAAKEPMAARLPGRGEQTRGGERERLLTARRSHGA